jgi:tRNA-Thr(GGU) m(6)t(6)A37 methyltransferase TsaA
MEYRIESIGIIHTPYKTKEECPIQGCVQPEGKGTVEVFPEYSEGLKDIETFSHVFLVYIFDRADEIELIRPTFLDDSPHGIFACRHPCRPNSIGISIVKLLKKEENLLEVSGIDILDGTPLIDIKPYVPRFDHFADATDGWAAQKRIRPKPPGRE